jgi:hypothetical protein
MTTRNRNLVILLLVVSAGCLSAAHANMLGSLHLDYNIRTGELILGFLSLAIGLLVQIPKNKLLALCCIIGLPPFCAIVFSWAELLADWNLDQGTGNAWLLKSLVASFAGFFSGTAIKEMVRRHFPSRDDDISRAD